MTLKLLHLWRQSQKICTPQPKNFFSSVIYEAGRSGWALEQLSSAIDGGARALVRQPKTAVLGWNQSTNISYPGSQSVKMIGLTMRSVTWNRFPIKNLWLIPCFFHLWSEITWIQIWASLNHCKKMKAKPSRLIPLKVFRKYRAFYSIIS